MSDWTTNPNDNNYEMRKCFECAGTGQIRGVEYEEDATPFFSIEECKHCEGYGKVEVNIRNKPDDWMAN